MNVPVHHTAAFEKMHGMSSIRLLPIGAEPLVGGATHFRVWAPRRQRLAVVVQQEWHATRRCPQTQIEMAAEGKTGYFSVIAPNAAAGALYRFRLDDDPFLFPDPASRFQPFGPRGPSQVIDPAAYAWHDRDWPGVQLPGQVVYEMHVGTFTPEGTWQAAARQLPELAETGITLLEVMPIAEWDGEFGWGYDGVDLFAPSRLYGTPDDFRRFVDAAHAAGIGVLLDVVYNHLGSQANYLKDYAADYFTDRYRNDWGDAINFDGAGSAPVREFFLTNARYWIEEFHLDGYRIDATQAFFDGSPKHILAELTQTARAAAGRPIVIIGENEPQDVRAVRPIERGGFGMDALWNDDFHHAATVRLTGRNEAYYSDYRGHPQEFVSLLKWGFLYQGQRYSWQKGPRGTPTFGLPAPTFVNYLQNHDQLANSAEGKRIHELTSPGRLRAMTAVLLLGPGTPLLFQGQEFAARAPFRYFLDDPPDRAAEIRAGRARFLGQFPSLALEEIQSRLADPADPQTFLACKLNFGDRESHFQTYALHKDLLELRRRDPALGAQRADRMEGAVLDADCFLMRFLPASGDDRLLLVNFGRDLQFNPAPEPLLAPPAHRRWETIWSSEDPKYGGGGTPPLCCDEIWRIPGEAAVWMVPVSGP
jgi:maltooligosyltrehalose trehalohydrolase